MTQNMEKYYGFRVLLTEDLEPEKLDQLKDVAPRIMKIQGYNPSEYILYFHQMILRLNKKHWSKKLPLHKRVEYLNLVFTVNQKQRGDENHESKIRFLNWYFKQGVGNSLGTPIDEHVLVINEQYRIEYCLDNEFIRDHSSWRNDFLEFKNIIITFVSKDLKKIEHRKIKAHVEAAPTEDFLSRLKDKDNAFRETALDFYFKKPLKLLPNSAPSSDLRLEYLSPETKTSPDTPSETSLKSNFDNSHKTVNTAGKYDIFISHASEDKASVARPLYESLKERGVSVWFDEAELKLGDSLSENIDRGLANCRYGVIVISPAFMAKKWTQQELNALISRETITGKKAILPIWHEVDDATVAGYSPISSGKLAADSRDGIPSIVDKIIAVLIK